MTVGLCGGFHKTWWTQDRFNLRNCDASEDANKQFSSQSFLQSRVVKAGVEVLWLAAEEDGISCLDSQYVLPLRNGNRDWLWKRCKPFFQSLG